MPGQVLRNSRFEPVARKHSGDRLRLIEPYFDRGNAVGVEEPGQLRCQFAISVEALVAGKQGLVRLIFLDAGTKVRTLGDIRRVAEDEVEPLGEALRPVSELERDALLETEPPRVGGCIGQCLT